VSQNAINRRLYQRRELVEMYGSRADLLPVESAVLVRYRDEVLARHVLDLGCGGGRLAAHLRLFTTHYLGIDISPHMIEHCRRRFPDLRFAEGDIRWLDGIDTRSFAVVFAVANLIDAVDHDDRLRALGEVHRVLAPGGLFVFSTHNRNWALAGTPPRLQRSLRPMVQLRAGVDYVVQCYRHVVLRRFEHVASDYAVLNDPGRGYSLLHYYIGREAQRRQLAATGFTLLEVLGESGSPIAAHDDDRGYSSLMYVARRD
jgi:SAM-dependent methyltransferase